MASSHTSTISARDRARAANAARLAGEQERLKKVEDDLVRFFKAQELREKIADDAKVRIARIREETDQKIADADRSGALAITDLKSRGEAVSSIAQLTGLTTTEVNKLLRSTRPAKPKAEKESADKTNKTDPKIDTASGGTKAPGSSIDSSAPAS
ncbi:hypothetical protein [Rhodococcus qingshengii]|uniref:hypothetical protein n=1 Tax=Rhodococcus qingshengii TaxID=334542 RepID=UPI0022B5BD60|nr:hypothetical protein [Rhodococcus qingshengii]MCZ4618441.1 hypothetical protein [Rhodococcus qingshengii]